MPDIESIKDDCKTKAQWALATHYILLRKRDRINALLKLNTVLGVLMPALLGAIISTYGQHKIIFYIAGAIGIIQLILSVLSLVYRWDDLVMKYFESCVANKRLFDDFTYLYLNEDDNERLVSDYQALRTKNQSQEAIDYQFKFTENENRIGNRYAYHIMNIDCPTCKFKKEEIDGKICRTCGLTKK